MNKISHFLFLFHFLPRKLHPDGWTPKSRWSSQQYVAPLCPWVNISTRGTVLLLFLFDSKFFSKMCDILKYGLSGQVVKMKTVPLLRLKYNAVTLHGERLPASRLVRAMNLSKHSAFQRINWYKNAFFARQLQPEWVLLSAWDIIEYRVLAPAAEDCCHPTPL